MWDKKYRDGLVGAIVEAHENGGKVLVAGNGGLAACVLPETKVLKLKSDHKFRRRNRASIAARISDIKDGDFVLSYNTKNGNKEFNEVTAIYKRQVNELLELEFSNGNKLILTTGHPVAVVNAGLEWMSASELKVGDKCLQYKYGGLNFRLRNIRAKGKRYEQLYGNRDKAKKHSVAMKALWKDYESAYNSPSYMKGERNSFWGKRHSEETKLSLSVLMKKRWANSDDKVNSLEYRKKLSERSKKAWGNPDSAFYSEEYREQLKRNAKRHGELLKGKSLEEIYGIDKAKEIRQKLSKVTSGGNNPMFGKVSFSKGRSYEDIYGKRKAKQLKRERKQNMKLQYVEGIGVALPSNRKKLIQKLTGRKLTVEHRAKAIKALEKSRNDPVCVKRYFKGLNARPNKSEKKLSYILRKVCPHEFKYNGDARLGVVLGGYIPDFVNVNGKKKLIEFYGCYHHACSECGFDKGELAKNIEKDKRRDGVYKKLGWNYLIIWSHDLKDMDALKTKIKNYVYNPNIETVSITKVTNRKMEKPVDVYNLEVKDNNNYFAYGILVHNCAEHFSAELVGKYAFDIYVPCISLTTNTSLITALANDIGFEDVFAHQIKILGKKGDVLIAMTTSRSPNVVRAIEQAREQELVVAVICGGRSGKFDAEYVYSMAGRDTAEIQDKAMEFLHTVAYEVKKQLVQGGKNV